MSNRNLVISIVVIIVAAVGIWAVIRTFRQAPSANDNAAANNTQTVNNNNTPVNNNTNTSVAGCQRDFDAGKLQNDKVDTKNRRVTMQVKDLGNVVVELYGQDAPKTVENFLRLANSGYYDCLIFHRVAAGFVIQTGDPTGTGKGGDSAFGGEFADELNAKTASYKTGYVKGILAMANRGENTNTSQFFITLNDVNQQLPKNYTIFGKVLQGQDIVDKIGQAQTDPPGDGAPLQPIIIEKAFISK